VNEVKRNAMIKALVLQWINLELATHAHSVFIVTVYLPVRASVSA